MTKLTNFIESTQVRNFIIGVIIFNAIILGLETSATMMLNFGELIQSLDKICLKIFVIELALKLVAYRFRFFMNWWNIFDTLVVAVSLVPTGGSFTVLRALRIFRVLRVISTAPRLRRVVELPPALIPWIVFPLLGPIFRSGAHIKVDLLMNFLTKSQILVMEILVCVVVLVGAGIFFMAGIEAVELFKRLGQLMELEIEIPIWWMYLAFPVGFAILISFVVEMILEKFSELYQLSQSSK